MSQVNVLLLDLSPDGDFRRDLCEIFSPAPLAGAARRHDLNVALRRPDLSLLGRQEVASLFTRGTYDVIFLALPGDALDVAGRLLRGLNLPSDRPPLIVATEGQNPESLFDLLELGAADFVTAPLKAHDLLPRLWRLAEQRRRRDVSLHSLREKIGLQQFVGESRAFREAVRKLPRLARCDASVMITGETGTGKEMCARAIHYLSPRAACPFVAVNCGAIPAELIENEFFGHKRGAFTDAGRTHLGLISEADGGSLFLDEVDALQPAAQVKLLRFLQEGEYRPLGSAKSLRSDVRVIAATNADIEEAVRTGRLRQDLFYRLNVLPLALPPLRDRQADIPLLARHFLARHAAAFNSAAREFTDGTLERLVHYRWPGNVRELENLIARVAALAEREVIEAEDLGLPEENAIPRATSLREARARFECSYIEDLLHMHQGNITKAAQAARKDRRSFWELIRKHKIDASHFRPETRT
ncbi:MAG TPA: sigma-54 dependent transcriptional regulator [Blastocatellia bacterium]|nr:sigma-54 dependent transcriptional regulator [Blastocatellia bacterium]